MTLLLITMAAAWFMAGLGAMVQVVHYPLFARVGEAGWSAYHVAHSRRITVLVVPAMSIELGGAVLVVLDRPDGVGAAVALAGAGFALATWVLTGLGAVPAHRVLASSFDRDAHRRLLLADRARTVGWAVHAVLAATMVAAAA